MSILSLAPLRVCQVHLSAEVAELADAHGSGPCTRKGVGVRVPSSAPCTNIFLYLQRNSYKWPQSAREMVKANLWRQWTAAAGVGQRSRPCNGLSPKGL